MNLENRPLRRLLEEAGPGPFITRRVFRHLDGTLRIWRSRHHRKGLTPPEEAQLRAVASLLRRCLWMPGTLNWWIGTVFALGSFLFGLGSVLSLYPEMARAFGLDATGVNLVYFAGSIPFTTAAYLQLYQAANAGEVSREDGRVTPPRRRAIFGWKPRDVGWLSCALQFPGTVLFNFNTFDAVLPGLDWAGQDLVVWLPNVVGSVLFLASGYLAFIETCHGFWRWEPGSLSWWVTLTNLAGCLGFMASALFAFVPPSGLSAMAALLATVFTLAGAVGFFIGSVLMLPEAAA
jgi:hypothetical protein